MNEYDQILESLDLISGFLDQIEEVGELTRKFPVGSFVKLNNALQDFRTEIEGYKNGKTDFNFTITF